MILPWRPEWSDNSLLLPYPAIRELVSNGFVRGVVTGLGLLNVWIGFWEACLLYTSPSPRDCS